MVLVFVFVVANYCHESLVLMLLLFLLLFVFVVVITVIIVVALPSFPTSSSVGRHVGPTDSKPLEGNNRGRAHGKGTTFWFTFL